MNELIKATHKKCSNNIELLKSSKNAGCFYCQKVFPSSEVKEFVDEGKTALCPYCGIDSLIPEAMEYELTKEFLEEMNRYWF